MIRKGRSKWLVVDNRQSIVKSRIVGLNLEGSPQKSFFFRKELQTTWFMFEYSIGGYRWTVKRSFESIKDFHAYLHKDPDLSRGRSMLTATFPAGRDGEVDTMVLIERREMIEHFVREVLGVLDFMFYEPLDEFIEGRENVIRVQRKLEVIVRNMRSYIAKKKLFYRLFKHYSAELLSFIYTLEGGVEVHDLLPPLGGRGELPHTTPADASGGGASDTQGSSILWLDICEEPALSRVCLASAEIHGLPAKFYEDVRLERGIFVSDIAEVRWGGAGEGAGVVSIIGAERVLTVQFPNTKDITVKKASGGVRWDDSPSATATSTAAATPTLDVCMFIDMLNLLSIQSLSSAELAQRNKKFTRAKSVPYTAASIQSKAPRGRSGSVSKAHAKRLFDAESMLKLLQGTRKGPQEAIDGGIEVEEEVFDPRGGGYELIPKRLVYMPEERMLYILKVSKPGDPADHEEDMMLLLEKARQPPIPEVPAEEETEEEEGSIPTPPKHTTSPASPSAPHPPPLSPPHTLASHHKHLALPSNLPPELLTYLYYRGDRAVPLDDICEVRVGRVSNYIDALLYPEREPSADAASETTSGNVLGGGAEAAGGIGQALRSAPLAPRPPSAGCQSISVIASLSTLILPIPSPHVRNNFQKMLSAFVHTYRSPARLPPLIWGGAAATANGVNAPQGGAENKHLGAGSWSPASPPITPNNNSSYTTYNNNNNTSLTPPRGWGGALTPISPAYLRNSNTLRASSSSNQASSPPGSGGTNSLSMLRRSSRSGGTGGTGGGSISEVLNTLRVSDIDHY